MAIRSFGDRVTEEFFLTGRIVKSVGWASIQGVARRKLDMIHYASILDDLLSPPGNRLERLHGKLGGYYSIRINQQWRIIFRWTSEGADSVRILDYH